MSLLVNFRDPAVLADPTGRLVRRGAFFRSAQPFPAAGPQTVAELVAHDIRTVVDLRGAIEVREEDWAAAVAAGVEVLRVPIESYGGVLDELLRTMETGEDLGAFYLALTETAPGAIAAAAEATARPGGVLLHCAAGKDRTGLLIALLLDLLGVAAERITADYAHTTEALPQIWAGLADRHRAALNDLDRARVKLPAPLLAAPVEAMTAFLDLVHTRHGSAAALLAHCGVPAGTLAAIRAKGAVGAVLEAAD